MQDQKNLILAIVLSVAIILLFQLVLAPEKATPPQGQPATTQQARPGTAPVPPGTAPGTAKPETRPQPKSRAEALAAAARVKIDAPKVTGSVSVKGGLLDDVTLRDYHETVDARSPGVHLLNPVAQGEGAYYVAFGWVPAGGETLDLPDENTLWTAEGGPLAPGKPVTLTWTNKDGLKFTRRFQIDDNYLVTVTDSVTNGSGKALKLSPYAFTRVNGEPKTLGFFILHEGPIAVFQSGADGSAVINDPSYKDIKEKSVTQDSFGGWLGFTSHYWLVSLIPQQDKTTRVRFLHDPRSDSYQADYTGAMQTLAPGGSTSAVHRVFAGPKQVDLLRSYGEQLHLKKFDWAIDFGWFWFFTKPFLFALKWIYGVVGNFGIAIMILTIVVKVLFFPLANKSYKSMSQMKKLQPEMARLRERFGSDKAQLNQEMMKLYRKERINPAAGCLPMVLQIPVFFALYKVLYVAIDMRHAPFFGWIHDLSVKDPTSLLNLFGLLPWAVPTEPSFIHFISIGAWPIIMGFTMFMQQRLNPSPPDPVQAKIFMWMPVIFTIMLAHFPAGLCIYYAWNNTLSIGQQWLIMKRSGALPRGPDKSVPRNIKELEARKAATAAAKEGKSTAKEKAGS
jgi:YidC/Oxa1 family membrane protein insertase